MAQNMQDQDLMKIAKLENRMRNRTFSERELKNSENYEYEQKNQNVFENDCYYLLESKDFSLGNNEKERDKENFFPLEEEKHEFSLRNSLFEMENLNPIEPEIKRKAQINNYYPIFKKIKTDEYHLKIFMDERNGFSENSNDHFPLTNVKDNRKITEYFKKQKNQKNFVHNLISNEGIKNQNKDENSKNSLKMQKTKISAKDSSNLNKLKNVTLRKISFGDSNSNAEIFLNTGSNDKKLKEKEKLKLSSEKVAEENFKLKDEIRKLNKILVDKDSILKNEEVHLRHISNENKLLYEKVNYYEQQLNKTQKNQSVICKLLLETENRRKQELKHYLTTQKQRLGEFVSQRQGHKFIDVWVDGYEIRNIKEKLNNLKNEREEIEKTKKTLAKKNGTVNPFCINTIKQEKSDSDNHDSNSTSDFSVYDVKNRLTFKNNILQKEEQTLLEELKRLEHEKNSFIYKSKLFYEEEHCRFSKPDNETRFPAWPLINSKYQILSLLGKGGFSEVYKAFDLIHLTEVACKMHHLNSAWSESTKHQYIKHALRENEIHQSLKHPNIVKHHETIELDSNTLCTVLEYCEGPDLSQYMKQYKCIPEKEAKCILKQIISGLKYLHEDKKKIIHYDLKPQNIIFHKGEIKISDFGLCKIVEDNATKLELTSQGVGTYWYLPPECFEIGENPPIISTKVDIWSLGVIFFEMLFGEKPFGNNMSQEKILKDQVILNSDSVKFPNKPTISIESKELISLCLIKDPVRRPDINGIIAQICAPKKQNREMQTKNQKIFQN